MTLFILQPFVSHYYPTFALAKSIQKNGVGVTFTGRPPLKLTILQEGFDYHEFTYLNEFVVRNFRTFLGYLIKSVSSLDFYKSRKDEFNTAYQNTKKLVEKIKPDHVYLDQSLADYYFFFKPLVPNITILHTKVYSGKVTGIPPMNTFFIPRYTRYSNVISELKWAFLISKQRLNELVLKAAFLGKDENYFWKKHCQKYGMNWEEITDNKHALNRGIKGVDNMVLCPRHLEFPNFKTSQQVEFFGTLSQKSESLFFSNQYLEFKNKIILNSHRVVIYLAFGSLASTSGKIFNFFNDVIAVVASIQDAVLIISKGGNLPLNSSKNAISFEFLPQQDVLSYTNLFITHGGLGSVKEAYHLGVPMLVVPVNKRIDQPGNAARVKAAKLGDFLNIDSYSKKELADKINKLLKYTRNSQTVLQQHS